MKPPSIRILFRRTIRTFGRFSFSLISALAGSIAAIWLVEVSSSHPASAEVLNRVLLTAALGIPLFAAVTLFSEKRGFVPPVAFGPSILALTLLGIYYGTLPADITLPPALHIVRYGLFSLAAHLLVSFLPFLAAGENNGFWQYNKTLFLRFLTAGLFSAFLFAGLAIALAAVDHLFEINMKGERYFQLWIAIAGVFNTWFFLASLPEDIRALEQEKEYPRGLKVFAQFILIPLVVLYMIILYAYMAKILVEWNWPEGWVANLILGFSLTGILALLLIHPLRESSGSLWLARFARWYYVVLIPLLPLLLLAIWRRISDYGLTENRYFVVLLGVWLTGTVVYFLTSRTRTLKVIPVSLCALALLSSFGPWGAFRMSERSQVHRLRALLVKNGMLVEGKIRKAPGQVSFEDTREISSALRYLHEMHTLGAIEEALPQGLNGVPGADSLRMSQSDGMPKAVVAMMGLNYVGRWQTQKASYHSFRATKSGVFEILGYERYLRSVTMHRVQGAPGTAEQYGDSISLRQMPGGFSLLFRPGNQETDSVVFDLRPMAKDLIGEFGQMRATNVPPAKMTMVCSGSRVRVRADLLQLNVQAFGDSLDIPMMEADLFIASGARGQR